MASSNIARLGVVLGIDTAEFTAGVDKAIAENKKLKASIQRETNAAAKEILALKYATEDYGKALTKTEQMQREITSGRFMNATKEAKNLLLQQARAYDEVAASAKKAAQAQMGAGGFGKTGQLNAQQIAALSYQTTDIVTGLASGQNPLIVLIQQGGQLRDTFGGVTGVFRAYASILTPMRLALGGVAAAVGALAFMFYKGQQEAARLRDDLILTNNIAGLTNNSFQALSESLNTVNVRAAKDIFGGLIASGKFTQTTMISVAEAIAQVSRLSGESASEVTKNLINAFDGSASSAKRLNDTYNFLTVSQYRYIEQLNQQGKSQEAAKYTADLLTESLAGQNRQLGIIEKSLSMLKRGWASFWDAALDIGRPETDTDKLARLARTIEKFSKFEGTKGESDAAKKNRQKTIADALKEYTELSEKIIKDQADANQKSEKLAKEKQDMENYIRAGGLQREQALVLENERIINDIKFQKAVEGANEFRRIELEAEKKIADERIRVREQNIKETYVFASQNAKNLAAFEIKVEEEKQQRIAEINRQERKVVLDRQFQDQLEIQQQREKLNLYAENVLISEQDYKLGLARLETEQKIADIMRRDRLTDEAKAELVNRERQIGEARQGILQFENRLQVLRSVNQAVFSNMGSAIDNFVRSGKLSFKDFTRSVIQDLIAIQLKAQATALLSRAGGFLTSVFSAGASTGATSGSGGFGINPNAGGFGLRANGGDVFSNTPYIVGEKGPELFVPRNAGTIVPTNQMASAMAQPQVIYNGPYIANMSAIDTQSATQFLARNKEAVWSANQSASRGLPASR